MISLKQCNSFTLKPHSEFSLLTYRLTSNIILHLQPIMSNMPGRKKELTQ